MSKSLEERLKTHSSAFDGLLSLIPAKFYYDSATQDQWQLKKQSKEETRDNKRAKLDPESFKKADGYSNFGASAKEVLDIKGEKAQPVRLPGSVALGDTEGSAPTTDEAKAPAKTKRSAKMVAAQSAAAEARAAAAAAAAAAASDSDSAASNGMDIDSDLESTTSDVPLITKDMDVPFDTLEEKPEPAKPAEVDPARAENLRLLRERLAARIQLLKAKRRAPGTNVPGAPKSRDQILEERKRKKEESKKRKLEPKEESESDSSDSEAEPKEESKANAVPQAAGVLFQNIEFSDGLKVTSDLSAIRGVSKKKGPANNDIKAHLRNIEKNNERLSMLSPEDRAKKEDQQKWTKVMAQAEGKKIKDDVNLLKKSLRKKEAGKRKSAGEWVERKENVTASIAAKVKRREDNLQLRKENKGVKGKKQQKMLKSMKGVVDGGRHLKRTESAKKKRAGFEGKKHRG